MFRVSTRPFEGLGTYSSRQARALSAVNKVIYVLLQIVGVHRLFSYSPLLYQRTRPELYSLTPDWNQR